MVPVNKRYIYLLGLLIPVTVFTKEIGMYELGGIQLDLISYPFFIIAFLIFFIQGNIKVNKWERIIFIVLLLQGLLSSVIFDLPLILFFKQYVPIFLVYVVCKNIMIRADIYKIFELYISFSLIASFIGILQFILKLFGILILTPYSDLFIDSVALEPSHYVAIVLPAAIYLFERKEFTWKFFVIASSLILTFKLTFAASVLLYLIFKRANKLLPLLIISPIAIYVFFIIISKNIEFTDRIESILLFYQTQDIEDVSNLTSFSFASNFQVAINNFIDSFGLGVGLGGHETTYFTYFKDAHIYMDDIGLNAKSGHSLIIRAFSELGIVSIIMAFVLFKQILKVKSIENRAIVLAALSHFIVKSIKLGGYFDYGTLFFLTTIIVVLKLENWKGYLTPPTKSSIKDPLSNEPLAL